jgi:hypothetical protein
MTEEGSGGVFIDREKADAERRSRKAFGGLIKEGRTRGLQDLHGLWHDARHAQHELLTVTNVEDNKGYERHEDRGRRLELK